VYLKAYELLEALKKDLVTEEAQIKSQEGKVLEHKIVIHLMLRAQVLVAKCLNKIKDFAKAEQVCEDVESFLEEYASENEVEGKLACEKFFKFSVKAKYIRAKNMWNVMEFKKAKEILEDEAKPILKSLIDRYHIREEDEIQDLTKDLVDNRYSFEYRKKYALYLKKFAFYMQSAEILTTILQEEIAYYKLTPQAAASADEEGPFKTVSLEGLKEAVKKEESLKHNKAVPWFHLRATYYQLGKVYVFQLKVKEALQALKIAEDITYEAYGFEEHLYVSNIKKLEKEAHFKAYSQRNKQALEDAASAADHSLRILTKVLGGDDKPNYLVAKGLLNVGDVLIQKKSIDEAE
jgi:hypothetical protein